VRFIEIFWWELCSPEPVCETVTVPNPDYDPDDPDSPPTIEEDQWIIPACSGTPVPGTRTGISCDEDPPPRRSAFFRSINGWWGLPGWNWGWWHGIGWWTPGFGPGHVAWSDAYWWGPFGANWWGWHWLGGPPTDDDLLELPGDEPPPTPPCGGIIRRHRYGFIMWEYGWRILGTDRDNEVATIAGPFEFRTRLVVENPDPPDPSCDDDSGY
jgi:hypothetical protein